MMITNPNDLTAAIQKRLVQTPSPDRLMEYDFKIEHESLGLTKREYFAAMALQGILSGVCGVEQLSSVHPASWSDTAVQCADSLIAELNKGKL